MQAKKSTRAEAILFILPCPTCTWRFTDGAHFYPCEQPKSHDILVPSSLNVTIFFLLQICTSVALLQFGCLSHVQSHV